MYLLDILSPFISGKVILILDVFTIIAQISKMEIEILHRVEGARKARGLTVVIDVFRAFSLAVYAFDAGATSIIPVGDLEKARELKRKNPGYLLIGERNENKVPDFDFGNSPSHIMNIDLTGKTLVHTTSAGTQGLVNAVNADEVLTGAFVNASAIVNYITKKNPESVSLVCMGYAAEYPVEEDNLCAEYIENELKGVESNFSEYKEIIRNTSGKRFFEKNKQHFSPASDFDLCLQLNRFNFVLKAEQDKSFLRLKKTEIEI